MNHPTRTLLRERPVDAQVIDRLRASGIHPVLARIYAGRGIQHPDQIDTGLAGLIAPQRMAHIREAAEMLAEAIRERRHLLVVADFDADGATACAVALRGLRRFGADVDFLVPDRFVFGYGLTPALIDHAVTCHVERPVDMIITVDNGISSIAGVERANQLGIRVLITDHHLPGRQLPAALIVNPNLPNCGFPSKHLAGVGVMFYVLMALRAHLRDVEGWPAEQIPRLDDLLPIVALGTVADVVRLDANNRRLVAQGLARIRRGTAPAGLQALFQVARIDIRQANATHFGFAIGPRINAAGRLSDMSVGIRCLLEDDHQPALDLARQLDELNRERRSIEADAREQAAAQAAALLAEQQTDQDRIGLVLHAPTWHQGVIGLVAGRLKESLYRPVIVFTDDGDSGRIKGSCRSIPGIHIRDVLERVDTRHPGMILAFGGHAMAAGLTLQGDRLGHFREAFEEALRDFADPADLENVTDTDGPLQPAEMQLDTARLLTGEVWGQGFPPPLFRNTFRVLNQRQLQERHLKLVLAPTDAATMRLDAIWFNGPPDIGSHAELLYRLAVNEWDGRSTIQLEIIGRA